LAAVDLLKKLPSGQQHPVKERNVYLKDYQIECEECDETSYVAAYKKPKYCPICGRRAEAEEVDDVDL
jgi:rubrerythrin